MDDKDILDRTTIGTTCGRQVDVERIVQRLREHSGVRTSPGPASSLAEAAGAPAPRLVALREARALMRDIVARTQSFESISQEIGQPTLKHPSLRGRVAHVVMRLLGQVFWWYTWRLKQAFAVLSQKLSSQFEQYSRVSDFLIQAHVESTSSLEFLRSEVAELKLAIDTKAKTTEVAELQRAVDTKARTTELVDLKRDVIDLVSHFASLGQRIDSVRDDLLAKHGAIRSSLTAEAVAREAVGTQLAEAIPHFGPIYKRLDELSRYTQQLRSSLTLQEARVSVLLREARAYVSGAPIERDGIEAFATKDTRDLDALYVAFEDAFRGTREEVKGKQRVYIPLVTQNCGIDGRLLDIGCGRGEWLELLRDNGFSGHGIDCNDSMVKLCRGLGLEAQRANAIDYLRTLSASSLTVVTAFHVVAHLAFGDVLDLIDECLRVLKPGGLLIFETPNPANILVGAQNFYMDPTHVRPMPSAMLRFFVEARGFCDVYVRELNPEPYVLRIADLGPVAERFNQAFYGPRDYAVIGNRICSRL